MLSYVRKSRSNESTTLDLIDVAMPVLLLFFRQCIEDLFVDDVLDADEPCIGLLALINNALVYIFVQVRAVMVSWQLSTHVP
jgi:hypothetical protein